MSVIGAFMVSLMGRSKKSGSLCSGTAAVQAKARQRKVGAVLTRPTIMVGLGRVIILFCKERRIAMRTRYTRLLLIGFVLVFFIVPNVFAQSARFGGTLRLSGGNIQIAQYGTFKLLFRVERGHWYAYDLLGNLSFVNKRMRYPLSSGYTKRGTVTGTLRYAGMSCRYRTDLSCTPIAYGQYMSTVIGMYVWCPNMGSGYVVYRGRLRHL